MRDGGASFSITINCSVSNLLYLNAHVVNCMMAGEQTNPKDTSVSGGLRFFCG